MLGKWMRRVLILIVLVAVLLFVGMAKYGWEIAGIKMHKQLDANKIEKDLKREIKQESKKVEEIGKEILDIIEEESSEVADTIKEKIDDLKSEEKDKPEVTEEDEKKLDEIIEKHSKDE